MKILEEQFKVLNLNVIYNALVYVLFVGPSNSKISEAVFEKSANLDVPG